MQLLHMQGHTAHTLANLKTLFKC